MVVCLEQGADLHIAQLMPLPLTVSCFSKIQIGFTFLVPAHISGLQAKTLWDNIKAINIETKTAILHSGVYHLLLITLRWHSLASVCLLAMTVSCAKTAEPNKTPFGAVDSDGPKEP